MMKKIVVIAFMALQWGWAQEAKVAVVDWKLDEADPIAQEENKLRCSVRGMPISYQNNLPFKLYHFSFENEQWQTRQDIYTVLTTRVPTLQVSARSNFGFNPQLRGRGGTAPIIIVDGIRYDASILDFLNPNDIECITVANGVAAANYFRTH